MEEKRIEETGLREHLLNRTLVVPDGAREAPTAAPGAKERPLSEYDCGTCGTRLCYHGNCLNCGECYACSIEPARAELALDAGNVAPGERPVAVFDGFNLAGIADSCGFRCDPRATLAADWNRFAVAIWKRIPDMLAPPISLPPVEVGPLPHLADSLSQVTSEGEARAREVAPGRIRPVVCGNNQRVHEFSTECSDPVIDVPPGMKIADARAAREVPTAGLVRALKAEVARLTQLINTPEIIDFVKAVQIEAVHQRERWGTEQDEGKTAADWFWLLGYLAGKALHSDKVGDQKKLLHHIITTAAACANWHAQVLGKCDMRPGIETPKGEAS